LDVPYRPTAGGVEIRVRVTPRAARAGLAGLHRGVDGQVHLVIRVGVPPEGGRANEAMLRILAAALGLGPSSLRLTAGAASRLKRVLVDADPALVAARLEAHLG
jgi:uncharacterized protein YggU (UPF0235/DUF167 family)